MTRRRSARALSVGARWTLRYTGATVLLIGLLSFFLYDRLARQIDREAEEDLAREVAEVSVAVAQNPDRAHIEAFIDLEIGTTRPEFRFAVELFDRSGQPWIRRDLLAPFTEALPELPAPPAAAPSVYRIDRGDPDPHLVMVARNGAGITRLSLYLGPYASRIRNIGNLFAATATGAFLLTGLMGWWLVRQSLRPIAEITQAARRISGAPESGSIAVTGSGDELDDLAVTLNEMLGRIRSAIERMRRFSAEAAHELRTPLASLQTRLEVMLEKERSPADYRRVLEETLFDLRGLGEGVRSMLRLAHFEAGLEPGQSQPVPLRPLLESVTTFFQPIAEERGIRLTLAPGFDRTIQGDRSWLERMFANLVDNAIKYSGPGGRVAIEALDTAEGVAVSVADSGAGLDPSERERVFERFFRGRAHRGAEPGTGIGLPLAQEIARAHGGTIELESEPGRGSTFRVRLPAAPRAGSPGGNP